MAATTREAVRAITPEEIDRFGQNGWVQLKRFIDPDVIRQMHAMALEMMGEDGDSNEVRTVVENGVERKNVTGHFNTQVTRGLTNPVLGPVIRGAAQAAQKLMALRRGPDIQVRYNTDAFIPKLPASRETVHGGNNITPWHHDYGDTSLDRSGSMSWWMPLEAYGPEFGTMTFVNGSQHYGSLGQYSTFGRRGGELFDYYPALRDLPRTGPLTYELGDVTVHSDLTVHGSGLNTTDRPRWAYLLHMSPGDACWNGGRLHSCDTSSMTLFQELPDERYPIIAGPVRETAAAR